MYIYLAARYTRRLELCQYRMALEDLGHVITSHWLDGVDSHLDTGSNVLPLAIAQKHAKQDLVDIDAAQLVIAFTEEAGTPYRRGGRHWEAGYAYATGKAMLVVGPLENIFYTLPRCQHYATWEQCYEALTPANVAEE